MATFTKIPLSGSTDGRGIHINDDATAGKTIHTGSATATVTDEIWLYAVNYDSTARKLTIEWGSATDPDGHIEVTVLPEAGLVTVIPGLLLQGNATAKVVRAFAGTADKIVVHGFVNRITA